MYRAVGPIASAAILVLVTGAAAERIPGPVDRAIIGDWQCGATRVYINFLGSIQLMDEDYTAGLIRAADGEMLIEWDVDSSRTAWSYAVDGGELMLMPRDASDMRCSPRP